MSRTPFRARRSADRAIARAALVGAAGVALGVLTAFAQEYLPREIGPLANSSGPWALLASALALLARTRRTAPLFGTLALASLLAGYLVGSDVRGYPVSQTLILFWGAAGLIVGPSLGVGAYWIRTGRGSRAALGVGAVSGILAGEGLYGLLFLAHGQYPPRYWLSEAILGATFLVVVGARRLRTGLVGAEAGVATALTAVAFIVVYRLDLIGTLP